MFSSTLRLWHSLEQVQSLQESLPVEEMENYVSACNRRMYQQFHADRDTIDPADLVEVRYEDLAADPLVTVKRLYSVLSLGDFDETEPNLQSRLKDHRDYVPNQHAVDNEQRQKVAALWPEYCQHYAR